MLKRVSHLLLVSLLAGCVSSPIPEGYAGPTAVLRDSGRFDGEGPAQFFFVSEVDGKRIENSLSRTRVANSGRGALLLPVLIRREVPAAPLLIKLEGRTAYGMPIQEIMNGSRMHSVVQLVKFEPKAGGSYIVRGELSSEKREVWLEDDSTGQRVEVQLENK